MSSQSIAKLLKRICLYLVSQHKCLLENNLKISDVLDQSIEKLLVEMNMFVISSQHMEEKSLTGEDSSEAEPLDQHITSISHQDVSVETHENNMEDNHESTNNADIPSENLKNLQKDDKAVHIEQDIETNRIPLNKVIIETGDENLEDEDEIYYKPKMLECTLCSKTYFNISALKHHMETTHSEDRKFACHICDKKYKTKQILKIHLTKHTGERPLKCPQCPKRFYHPSSLRVHVIAHSRETKYFCLRCSAKFHTTVDLKQHIRVHTGDDVFPCHLCLATYEKFKDLQSHMEDHNIVKPCQCEVCGIGLCSKGSLRRHMLTHTGERPYPCPKCPAKYFSTSSLKVHMQTHSGTKPYQCDRCSTKFGHLGNLKTHKKKCCKNIPTADSDTVVYCEEIN